MNAPAVPITTATTETSTILLLAVGKSPSLLTLSLVDSIHRRRILPISPHYLQVSDQEL